VIISLSLRSFESSLPCWSYSLTGPLRPGCYEQEGDIQYNITVKILYSPDPDYGSESPNPEGYSGKFQQILQFYTLDDPSDNNPTTCWAGEYGLYPICQKCPAGKYTELYGDKLDCRPCPPGTYGLVSGAISLGAGTDFYGATTDPGCLPCPAGTYNENWNSTRCRKCSRDYYTQAGLLANESCYPMGTVAPAAKNVTKMTTGVTHLWSLLSAIEFTGTLNFGFYSVTQGLGDFQTTLMGLGLTVFIMVLVMIYSYKACMRQQDWENLKARIVGMDKFVDDHLESSTGGEPKKLFIGGMTSIASGIVTFMLVAVMVYNYVAFNGDTSQALVPVDDSFLSTVSTRLRVVVRFMSYSGCEFTLEESNYPDITILDGGMTIDPLLGARQRAYCYEGNLHTEWETARMEVFSVPTLSYALAPVCPPCTKVYHGSSPLKNNYNNLNNDVYECGGCFAASAQWIEWEVEGSGLYAGDTNGAHGQLVPSTPDSVFRGGTKSAIQISLIPTSYVDSVKSESSSGFRLQYSTQVYGSLSTFTTFSNVSFYEGDGIDVSARPP
jgi:hypothetical protein